MINIVKSILKRLPCYAFFYKVFQRVRLFLSVDTNLAMYKQCKRLNLEIAVGSFSFSKVYFSFITLFLFHCHIRKYFKRRAIFLMIWDFNIRNDDLPLFKDLIAEESLLLSVESLRFAVAVVKYLGRFDLVLPLRELLLHKMLSISKQSKKLSDPELCLVYSEISFIKEQENESQLDIDLFSADRYFKEYLDESKKHIELDQDFLSFINSKSVAVIGPSKVLSLNDADLDEFDVLIGCNYNGSKDFFSHLPRMPDISYFNCGKFAYFQSLDIKFNKRICWAVLKCGGDSSYVSNNFEYSRLMPRMKSSNGNYNLGQLLLFDLYQYSPSKVKFFGFDLMTSLGRSKNYLLPSFQKKYNFLDQTWDENYRRSSLSHDPVLNFFPVFYFWRIGFLSTDAPLERILSDGLYQYTRTLTSIYKRELL